VRVALVFDDASIFHDPEYAFAASVSTRALTSWAALCMAAAMNFVGAHLGSQVAQAVGKGIIDAPQGSHGLVIVAAGLIGAITWNMVTWYFGLPSSSSHALIGGLIGSALASSSVVHWSGVVDKVVIPMILSPLVGFTLAAAIMIAIYWIFRHAQPGKANRGFRYAQTVSAAAMALGHGLQD